MRIELNKVIRETTVIDSQEYGLPDILSEKPDSGSSVGTLNGTGWKWRTRRTNNDGPTIEVPIK